MTTLDVEDTIVAIASPPGGALRGIIRVSGPKTIDCLASLCFDENNERPLLNTKPTSKTVISCELAINPDSRLPGRLLVWPDQRSYTRQPTAEFHTIGSPPVLEMAVAAICKSGARLAERGEFTLRAFLSGRIDLTQAEAVLAVIDSENQDQLNNALEQLSGGLAGPLATIRQTLLGVLAELEAGLDFVEEDIEFITQEELSNRLEEARQLLLGLNEQIRNRNLNRQSFSVALFGHPNAGKSSLFNALLNDERAIVTNVEGTTRDFVTATANWNDVEIRLIDTAGLEPVDESQPSPGAIESQAQQQARRQLAQADLIVCCVPVSSSEDDFQAILQWRNISRTSEAPIFAVTKVDLLPRAAQENVKNRLGRYLDLRDPAGQVIMTSSIEFTGVEQLKNVICVAAKQSRSNTGSFVSTTATRSSDSLEAAEISVQRAIHAVHADLGLEIVAAELRHALHELGTVVGTVYTDDILDQIFSRFCIGK